MKKIKVLSGIQPSGNVTLGNYIGAIRRWVLLQNDSSRENFYFIVDLHSITTEYEPATLRKNVREMAAVLLAAGIDPARSTFFLQSQVPEHTELSWLLTCHTPLGWLEKMTQFKDKSQRQESVGSGLLTYPVLMAADILLYDINEVPVGEDQKQHVELARNIAQRMNFRYGEDLFVVPEPKLAEVGARIRGLDNPLVKMSKSLAHRPGHAVSLLDTDEYILKTFKTAKTDSFNEIKFSDEPERAGVDNLLCIYQALTDKSQSEVLADFANARGYGDLKIRVAETTIAAIRPIRERALELLNEPAELERIMARGAGKAREIASKKLALVKSRLGF